MATKKEKDAKLIKMLGDHKTTMLVTHDKQGGLVSRPMTTQKPEFDGDVWFFVSSDADVIAEIEANPEVNIAYSRDENFISLSGDAKIVEDDKKKKELWYPELKKWFNGEGPESEHVKLIKVSVHTGRYWDTSNAGSKDKKSGDSAKKDSAKKDSAKKDSAKSDSKKKEESPIESGIIEY